MQNPASIMSDIDHHPETASDRENIHGEIHDVSAIIERGGPRTEEERVQVIALLRTIETKMSAKREKMHSFFREKVQSKLEQLFPGDPLIARLKEAIPLVKELKLHIDGEKAFGAILRDIAEAKSSIFINIFIWRDDAIGNAVAKALLESADRGVRVTIRKDRKGAIFEHAEQNKQSFFHKQIGFVEAVKATAVDSMYQQPDEAHSSVQRENPLIAQLLAHPNIHIEAAERSDHSKYFVFDDRTIVMGGMNIGDEYRNRWHDYMVEVRNSPLCVSRLRESTDTARHPTDAPSVEFVANRVKEGVVDKADIKPTALDLLSRAQKEIIVEMSYFGDRDINAAIVAAARRGVSVTVLLPGHANIQDDLNKQVMSELLRESHNLQIYLMPRMSHAKCVMVDRSAAFLGSANFNTTATMELGETNILVRSPDAPFMRELLGQLQADIAGSTRVTEGQQLAFDPVKATMEASQAARDTAGPVTRKPIVRSEERRAERQSTGA